LLLKTWILQDLRRQYTGECHLFFPGSQEHTEQEDTHTWIHTALSVEAAVNLRLTHTQEERVLWWKNGYVFQTPWASYLKSPEGKGLYFCSARKANVLYYANPTGPLVPMEAEDSQLEGYEDIGVWCGTGKTLQEEARHPGARLQHSFLLAGKWDPPEALAMEALQTYCEKAPAPCLFLDRDGVLIEDVGYPHRKEDFHPNPEILPLLTWAKKQGWWCIGVTNQSGIAKGLFTEADYRVFTGYVEDFFRSKGVPLHGIYHCPYLPDGTTPPYNRKSLLRKPHPGMLLQASAHFPIEWEKSWMIGDRRGDVIPVLGLSSVLIRRQYPVEGSEPVFDTWRDLTEYITSRA